MIEQVLHCGKTRKAFKRLDGRKHQIDFTQATFFDRIGRAYPSLSDGLVIVLLGDLPDWRLRNKKTCVVAFGPPWHGDPVTEVGDLVGRDAKLLSLQYVDEGNFIFSQSSAQFRQAQCLVFVELHQLIIMSIAEQQPGLFKALANRGNPIGEAAFLDSKCIAGQIIC